MFAEPIREIKQIQRRQRQWKNKILKPGNNLLSGLSGELFHIQAELNIDDDVEETGFVIRDIPVVYNVQKQQLSCQKKTASLKPVNGKIHLEILVDRTSIEIFGNNGRVYMPMGVILADNSKSIEIFTKGGDTQVESMIVYKLGSVWR
jgi:sucrose-6-phosphate hydrolase SacC (GH32 family)